MAQSALTDQPFGYRKKPVRVYLVAYYLLIAPWIYLILTIRGMGDPEWILPATWIKYMQDLHPRVWFLLALTFVSALMLFLVRKSSWILAIIALALVILYNLAVFGKPPLPALVLLIFVIFTPFRKPYLNPRLRWWEQQPRFEVDLFAKVPEFQVRLHIYDISEGGILAKLEGDNFVPEGAVFYCEFDQGLKILCKVVRAQENRYLGIHFQEMTRVHKKDLHRLISGLQRRGEAKARVR